jgi:hypothetical protein
MSLVSIKTYAESKHHESDSSQSTGASIASVGLGVWRKPEWDVISVGGCWREAIQIVGFSSWMRLTVRLESDCNGLSTPCLSTLAVLMNKI